MRNRLIGGLMAMVMAAAACVAQTETTETGGAGVLMKVVLEGPATARLGQMNPDLATYDPVATQVRLVFTNTSDRVIEFPGEAIVQQVILRYRDQVIGQEQRSNITEPPYDQARLTRLGPGERWSYGLAFVFPDQVHARDVPSWALQVCAVWDQTFYFPALYPAGSYDWAEGFTACFDMTVRR